MEKRFLAVFCGLVLLNGVYAQTRLAAPNNPNASPGQGQSEIIINTDNADRDIVVWVNSVVAAHVPPKTREKIIVFNGRNVVEAADTTVKSGQWNVGTKRQITVDSNSNRVTIGLTTRYGALLNLTIQDTAAIGGGPAVAAAPPPAAAPAAASRATAASRAATAPAPAQSSGGGLRNIFTPRAATAAAADDSVEGALGRAADALIEELPNGATLAVLSIAAADKEMAEFVIEELAYFMVDAKKFKVVDRKSLDAIRDEQQFQFSDDVDDNSAVSIGKMLGASIVITGSITGSGSTRRLRAKALDVRTAEILTMASERF